MGLLFWSERKNLSSRDILLLCVCCKRNLKYLLGKIIVKILHFNTGVCMQLRSFHTAQRKTLTRVIKIIINIRSLKGEIT